MRPAAPPSCQRCRPGVHLVEVLLGRHHGVAHHVLGLGRVPTSDVLRIQRAAELLRHGAESISEVAFSVGFEDNNYFSRQFRKTTGTSPRDYRRGFAVS